MSGRIVYGCVGFRRTILALYSDISLGPLSAAIDGVVQQIGPNSSPKSSSKYDRFQLQLVVDQDFFALCVCDDTFPMRESFVFLEALKKAFTTQYTPSDMAYAGPMEMSSFNNVIQQLVDKHNDVDSHQFNKIKKEQDETQAILNEDINKMLKRGTMLEDIEDETTNLVHSSESFKSSAVHLKRSMWLKNMKLYFIAAAILLVCFI
ncbi:Vesicle-associated membrane protein [Entamoeba marina]